MKATHCFFLVLLFSAGRLSAIAQDQPDLLKLVDTDKPKKEYIDYAFKSSRVIMSHSMELIKPGTMDFRILHRFGNVNQGGYQFFGLDQATMRMSFDFGITKNLMLGVGRSTNKKEFDGFLKYRLIHQATGPGALPFSLVVVGGATMQTLKWPDPTVKNYFSSRLAYYGQLILGSKLTEGISLQLSPTILHRNLVDSVNNDPNDMYAIGVGGRIRISRRVSFTVDYFYRINPNGYYGSLKTHNPLSVGVDIETGGHVFQLHFTNAAGMNERAFLTETTNDWAKGDIQFGFNLSRTFQLKKKHR
ncbi:MAG TPA: DUF5777 family beta-barrel protein [Chitinophagaceae bacterium]|nr:DUF5777 family beta-barrel protein [Chitinophagaceae bacterium]